MIPAASEASDEIIRTPKCISTKAAILRLKPTPTRLPSPLASSSAAPWPNKPRPSNPGAALRKDTRYAPHLRFDSLSTGRWCRST
jgi:hypothetical protein